MAPFQEYDLVRVIRLIEPDRYFSGTLGVRRPPQVGDCGVIMAEYPSGSLCVENVGPNGYTIWLADFLPEELELVAWEDKKPSGEEPA